MKKLGRAGGGGKRRDFDRVEGGRRSERSPYGKQPVIVEVVDLEQRTFKDH